MGRQGAPRCSKRGKRPTARFRHGCIRSLVPGGDDAVAMIEGLAAGQAIEETLTAWITGRVAATIDHR